MQEVAPQLANSGRHINEVLLRPWVRVKIFMQTVEPLQLPKILSKPKSSEPGLMHMVPLPEMHPQSIVLVMAMCEYICGTNWFLQSVSKAKASKLGGAMQWALAGLQHHLHFHHLAR